MKITKKQAVLSLLYDLKDMCSWNYTDGILFGERLDTVIDEIENSIIEDKTIGI
jgi:hypothetical protein